MPHHTLITTAELSDHLSDHNCSIFDCRFNLNDAEEGRRLYEEAHIPGSLYVDLDADLSSEIIPGQTGRHPLPDREILAAKLRAWGVNQKDQVVIYDQYHGGLASRLWWLLKWLGHESVAVLDGGWLAWTTVAMPMTAEIPSQVEGNFDAQVSHWMTTSADKVQSLIGGGGGGCKLIDSRAAVRYSGIEEPLDPIAGHIPTAVNRPFLDNLNEQGHWKSRDQLRREWSTILGECDASASIIYCGSGVTACHNLLALSHAGFPPSVLYPGSWSEWITDAARPCVLPT